MVCIDTIATGENIRKALQAAGKTTADVRDECGFTSTTPVYKWFHGDCLPTLDNLLIVAAMCGVTMDSLVVKMKV